VSDGVGDLAYIDVRLGLGLLRTLPRASVVAMLAHLCFCVASPEAVSDDKLWWFR